MFRKVEATSISHRSGSCLNHHRTRRLNLEAKLPPLSCYEKTHRTFRRQPAGTPSPKHQMTRPALPAHPKVAKPTAACRAPYKLPYPTHLPQREPKACVYKRSGSVDENIARCVGILWYSFRRSLTGGLRFVPQAQQGDLAFCFVYSIGKCMTIMGGHVVLAFFFCVVGLINGFVFRQGR